MPNHHFVDTNVVVGYTVDWDRQYTTIQSYFQASNSAVEVHTSERVFDEAKKVINNRRQLTAQAANRVFHDFEESSYIKQQDVINFVRNELSGKPDGAVDHVLQYIKSQFSLFQGLVRGDDLIVLQHTLSDISDDFNRPISIIDDLRRKNHTEFHIEPFFDIEQDYSSTNTEHSIMNQLLPNSPVDRNILLDAHHLCNKNGLNGLYFVTMDRIDILSNQTDIENCLSSLHIRHPDVF